MLNRHSRKMLITYLMFVFTFAAIGVRPNNGNYAADPNVTGKNMESINKPKRTSSANWPMWGGHHSRNNAIVSADIHFEWPNCLDRSIRWTSRLGNSTFSSPVISDGQIFIGTNNTSGKVRRLPPEMDMGCLFCLSAKNGRFLWQYAVPKLAPPAVGDWPLTGITASPFVDNDRLWIVNGRGEIVCLDSRGFYDNENDGPYLDEPNENTKEADIIWKYDMRSELGVQANCVSHCSVICVGDTLLANTSHGTNEQSGRVPLLIAPSFVALHRNTGELLWSDSSPGRNILHGQWSSPTYAKIGGRKQAVFAGGDGWLYSFDLHGIQQGESRLLWKFDCNPKVSDWSIGFRSTRNSIVATPVFCDGLLYCAVGRRPDFGEGDGHLWCVDPKGNGDVSPTLGIRANGDPVPLAGGQRRLQYVLPNQGEKEVPNPNSAAVWHYGNRGKEFHQKMHRSSGSPVIKNGLLYMADVAGLVHCVDAKSGHCYWTHDLDAAVWGTALAIDDKVCVVDEDGRISAFKLSKRKEFVGQHQFQSAIFSTPAVSNDLLYIAGQNHLYAIECTATP